MSRFRGIPAQASFKGVFILALSVLLLLSTLLWNLPAKNMNLKEREAIKHTPEKSIPGKECFMLTPSKEDLKLLKQDANTITGYEMKDLMTKKPFCWYNNCFEKAFDANCVCGACNHFRVKLGLQSIEKNVTCAQLKGLIQSQRESLSYLKIQCNVGDKKWFNVDLIDRNCNEHAHLNSVHVINIGSMSRWEVTSRMSQLSNFVDMCSENGISVVDFHKYQATKLRNEEILSLLLNGQREPESLTETADRHGFHSRIFDFADIYQKRSVHLEHEFGKSKPKCLFHNEKDKLFDIHEVCNCSLYEDTDSGLDEKLVTLRHCFRVLEQHNINGSRTFTMSFMNFGALDATSERKSVEALEKLITDVVSPPARGIVILLSNMGNPSFRDLYNSLFIQIQSSNPLLYIFYPSQPEDSSLFTNLAKNQNKLVSLKDIHSTVLDFLSLDAKGNESISATSLVNSMLPDRNAEGIGVEGPNLPICQEQHVQFSNDSLQVGFAEHVVGILNNYIQEKIKTEQVHHCHRIVGTEFYNIRKSYSNNELVTSLDIRVHSLGYNESVVLRNITVKLQYDDGKIPEVDVVLSPGLDNFLSVRLFPFACSQKMSVEYSLLPETKIPLQLVQERSFGQKARTKTLHGECLMLIIHGFKDSSSYYVTNTCDDRQYEFTFTGVLKNVFSLVKLPVKVTVGSGQMYYLTSFLKTSYFVTDASYHYDTYYDMTLQNN